MSVLSACEPQAVLRWFERICAIPHGSFHTKALSDYIAAFAAQRGLPCVQDGANNLILSVPGSPGCENAPAVILQGHLDMVCEQEPGRNHDFLTQGPELMVQEGYVTANGTTLGGDDGIAVAYALALLDSPHLPHPPLEIVLTSDEEVGMLGAAALDCTPLKGRTMINLDSEEEGCLLVSCAGGLRADCLLPVRRSPASGLSAVIAVEGLTGGHSGAEIHRGRASAVDLLGRLLWDALRSLPCAVVSLSGGGKDNAIPRSAEAHVLIPPSQQEALENLTGRWQNVFAREYAATDPALSVTLRFGEEGTEAALIPEDARRAAAALLNLPNGVRRMSQDIPGLVQTSLNLGVLSTTAEAVRYAFSLRSSVGTEKADLYARLESIMDLLGGSVTASGDYPAWEYRKDSPLRETMVRVFQRQYGRWPEIQAIHAGLECGIFSDRLPGLDCVSIGPDMLDIHTPAERLSLASVERTWRYLCAVLKELGTTGA